jgi:dTDP-4-amino-4,6-dideoxygalactose transaminase
VKGLVVPRTRAGAEHVFHQYTVRIQDGRRDSVQKALEEAGIGTMVYYPKALHQLPVYPQGALSLPHTEAATREVLSLPMWPRIAAVVQETIAASIKGTMANS